MRRDKKELLYRWNRILKMIYHGALYLHITICNTTMGHFTKKRSHSAYYITG